jgi:hypothetical protein
MKTITFEEKQYKVPDWVEFVAKDENQKIFGYKETDVVLGKQEWLPRIINHSWFYVGKSESVEDWKGSKVRV